jgi:hypothetical protein
MTNDQTVTQADRDLTAEILGCRDWDDATDYRNSGEHDRNRDRILALVASHRTAHSGEGRSNGAGEVTQALLPVTPEARKAALDLMDDVGRVRADLYGAAILGGEWDECDELQAFARFERDILASQAHSLPGDVGTALRLARETIQIERDQLVDCCTVSGDRRTLEADAKPDVHRMETALAAIDAALTPSALSGEPAAWLYERGEPFPVRYIHDVRMPAYLADADGWTETPLYAALPPHQGAGEP